jgi:hypothetical protein
MSLTRLTTSASSWILPPIKKSIDNRILSFAIEYNHVEKPIWVDMNSYCLREIARLYDILSKSMPSRRVVNDKVLKMGTFDDALVLGVPRKRS